MNWWVYGARFIAGASAAILGVMIAFASAEEMEQLRRDTDGSIPFGAQAAHVVVLIGSAVMVAVGALTVMGDLP